MYRNKMNSASGFTIIELMLAMTFLSMLLLAIALTTMQLSHIYTKGTTMREVNQVGRVVIDDFRRTFASSTPASSEPITSDSERLRYQTNGSGQLCLGTYSYIWNSPKSLETAANTLKYSDGSTIYMARVVDKSRNYCKAAAVPKPVRSEATELLVSGDSNLVMRQLNVVSGASDLSSGKGQQLYALTFQLGTNTGDEAAVSSTSSCKVPNDASGNGMQDYCSVNKFEIVVRAGGDSTEAK